MKILDELFLDINDYQSNIVISGDFNLTSEEM